MSNMGVLKLGRDFLDTGAVVERKAAAGNGDDDLFGLFEIPFNKFLNGDLIICVDYSTINETPVELFRESSNDYRSAVLGETFNIELSIYPIGIAVKNEYATFEPG